MAPENLEIVHERLWGYWRSRCGNFRFLHSSNPETLKEVETAFTNEDGTEMKGLFEFIARSMHLRQQAGGDMFFREMEAYVEDFELTGGDPSKFNLKTNLKVGQFIKTIGDLL